MSDFDNEHEIPEPDDIDDEQDEVELAPRIVLPAAQALEILANGDVKTEYGILRWSSNYAFLIALEHQGILLNAVYKPQKGERPLWDFPDGTLCYRELAAFLTSEVLGWEIVPPTVLREAERGLGSVQLFIEHDTQINYFSYNDKPGDLLDQLHRFAAFDAMINNADRKGGHCLLDPDNHLWGIDHGIAFHNVHKLRTVIWEFADQPIPAPLLADIERLCGELENVESGYRQQLKKLISNIEIKAFQTRVQNLLKTGKFPVPGSGQNYPWPAI